MYGIELFRKIPKPLNIVNAPATAEELAVADGIRRPYTIAGQTMDYMVDIVRAFRLAKGKGTYVEVGTRNRGNIAYTATLLKKNPIIVDIDIERIPANEAMIASELSGKAKYTFIHGDSIAPQTVAQVKAAVGSKGADIIFCDSSHMYNHTLSEFDCYFSLVRPGGYLMYHDALWEGNTTDKGKHQALLAIDRYVPVYVVHQNFPVCRIHSHSSKGDVWGTVAIIPKPNK
jgi:cephalosporin hydroxylase